MKNTMEALMKLKAIKPETFNSRFYRDVVSGLQSEPKHLEAKYFYDAEGDRLFQQIILRAHAAYSGALSQALRLNAPTDADSHAAERLQNLQL